MIHETPGPSESDMNWTAPENNKENKPKVPFHEINIDFVRSSGPGGQKVNKTSSKAQLRWNIGESSEFSDIQKELIREVAGNKLNSEDEIVLSEQTERSQYQNRDTVIKRLQQLVDEALIVKKERKPTKPSKRQKQKRLDDKKKLGDKKKDRKVPQGGW